MNRPLGPNSNGAPRASLIALPTIAPMARCELIFIETGLHDYSSYINCIGDGDNIKRCINGRTHARLGNDVFVNDVVQVNVSKRT